MTLNIDYIAGFFDGEGCVWASKRDVRAIFTNTNLQILLDIQEYFGEGRITQKHRTPKDHANKLCYQLTMWNRRAERILKVMLPHLRLKRREAELALEIMSTFRKPGAPPGSNGNCALPQEMWDYRSALCAQIKAEKCA